MTQRDGSEHVIILEKHPDSRNTESRVGGCEDLKENPLYKRVESRNTRERFMLIYLMIMFRRSIEV